jgi:hypothetical protein
MPAFAAANINNQISYQARLMDPSGFPVADGAYSVKFSIYDSPSGGNRLWTASGSLVSPAAISVPVVNGLFTVLLGDTGQNTLDTVDWNQDSLYLGVTIGTDGEMTPRRRLGAAAQAFNARQLQGMYASSTAFGTSSLFAINQTSNTAATGTRTALEIRSAGTSDANDFLIRGINDLSNTVFSVNRRGNVTSTGVIAGNMVTTSQLFVAGSLVCLANGTNCASSGTSSLEQVTGIGATTSHMLTLYGGFIGASSTVTSTFTVLGATALQTLTATNATFSQVTTTNLFATTVSATQVLVNGQTVCLTGGTNCPGSAATTATLQQISNNGASTTNELYLFGGFMGASSTVTSTFTTVGNLFAKSDVIVGDNATTFAASSISHDLIDDLFIIQSDGGGDLALRTSQGGGSGIGAITIDPGGVTGGGMLTLAQTATDTVEIGASTTRPVFDLGGSLGIATARFNGYFGNTTTTNATTTNLFVSGMASTSQLFVNGSTVCLMNGINCPGMAASTATLQIVSNNGATTTNELYLQGGLITSSSTVTSSLNVLGALSYTALTSTSPFTIRVPSSSSTPNFDFGFNFTSTNTNAGYTLFRFNGGDDFTGQMISNDISSGNASGTLSYFDHTTDNYTVSLFGAGGVSGPNVSQISLYNTDNTADPGIHSAVEIQNGATNSSTAVLTLDGNGQRIVEHVGATSPEGSVFADAGSIYFRAQSTDAGTQAYLKTQNGNSTGWKAIATTDLISSDANDWTYNLANDSLRPTTNTTDLIFGNSTTNTADGAASYFDLSGLTNGTSTFYFGYNTNTNVIIGGTSTTVDFMHSGYALDGNDLFVGGNIGSVSSVYTNGEFVAGSASTHLGDGYLHASGSLTIFSDDVALGSATSVNIFGGSTADTSQNAGDVNVRAGAGPGSNSAGGNLNLRAGDGDFGGNINQFAGAGNVDGGYVDLEAGGGTTGQGGAMFLLAGSGATNGGVLDMEAGFGTAGNGGNLTLVSGGGGVNGGNMTITAGSGGTGPGGNIDLTAGAGASDGVINIKHATDFNPVELRFNDGNLTAKYIGFKAPSLISNSYSMTLPSAAGATGSAMVLTSPSTFAFKSVCQNDGTNCPSPTSTLYTFNSTITSASTTALSATPTAMLLDGRNAYVLENNGFGVQTLVTYDVSNPTSPTTSASVVMPYHTNQPSLTFNSDLQLLNMAFQDHFLFIPQYTSNTVDVVDVSNHASSTIVQTISVGASPTFLMVQGKYLYVTYNTTAASEIYDISNPTLATKIGSVTPESGYKIYRMYAKGNYLYVMSDNGLFGHFTIYDISKPTSPVLLSSKTLNNSGGNDFMDVTVQGNYAYLADNGNFHIYDISNPNSPKSTATTFFESGSEIIVNGRYAYIANGDDDGAQNIDINDVLDPGSPVLSSQLTSYNNPGNNRFLNLFVNGRYGFYVDPTQRKLKAILLGGYEVNNLEAHQAEIGSLTVRDNVSIDKMLNVNGGLSVGTGGIISDGGLFVSASGTSSTASFITNVVIGGTSTTNTGLNALFTMDGDDLFVHGNIGSVSSVYTNGEFVAGAGSTHFGDGYIDSLAGPLTLYANSASGTKLVNSLDNTLTTQTSFRTVSSTQVNGTFPIDVAVQGHYAYTVNETSNSISVFDVTNPSSPVRLTTFTSADSGGGDPRGEFISGHYLYVANEATGLLSIFDISRPASPVFVADQFSLVNPYGVYVQGDRAYVVGASGQFYVIDVSNPASPVLKSTTNLPATTARNVVVQGRYAYTANVDFTFSVIDISTSTPSIVGTGITHGNNVKAIRVDGDYLVTGSTGSSTVDVFDISVPTSPVRISTATLGGTIIANGNSVFLAGRYVYALTSGGINVIDIGDPYNPSVLSTFSIGTTPAGVYVSGRYAYTLGPSTNKLYIVDDSGIETNGLIAHAADLGTLQVESNATIIKDANVNGFLNIGGGLFSQGNMTASVSSTSSTAKFFNTSAGTDGTEWGAFVDKLAVGSNANATGTSNYRMVLTYASGGTSGGLCIDDTTTNNTCPSSVSSSLIADGAIIANGFDVAENYDISGSSTPGDVLVMDGTASSTVKMSDGTAYDPKVIGIVSTDPGYVLGWNQGAQVALTGRVPTHVNMENGPIRVGDALTTSHTPGYAMKATKAGQVVGYALEDAAATGTAEVFVAVGYSAGAVVGTDGTFTTVNDNVLMGPSGMASASNTTVDSWGLTFRGQAWDASSTSVVNRDFTLLTDVISATSSAFAIRNASGTDLFTLDDQGNASFNGDVQVGGKLYLSSRGSKQGDYYVFLDQSPSSTYIGTNADGFQSLDTYDFAERFFSPDALEPGDLVVVKDAGGQHVQRSWNENDMLVGIVSTRPAFVAGRPATDTYPIALTGRVPTKVSTLDGAIKAGDALAPSTLPGVAVKATKTGPIVGLALEDYDSDQIGKINVYVNPGWWTAPSSSQTTVSQNVITTSASTTTTSDTSRRGMAVIAAGSKQVHVGFATINAYPFVQVTPRGLITGSWGTENYTDKGFDIMLSQPQSFDVYFSWQVDALNTGDRLYQSDGTYLDLNQMTGLPTGTETATATVTSTLSDVSTTTTVSTSTVTDTGTAATSTNTSTTTTATTGTVTTIDTSSTPSDTTATPSSTATTTDATASSTI